MSIARKDDRHNADLVREISDSFARAVDNEPEPTAEPGTEPAESRPRFVITGDKRFPPRQGPSA
ncbi:hypothetical protein FHU38_004333 [Saccharomonospora amisosensis]|uniref:Uncharacterized protein n=1 Tax=Saccharomonospora amisosensis TaxID=1128677 RepID=A0A7X5ZSI3_9PSEU|nr:hypothetical protein [Saccharomonospora amisosensis]NIJ13989.1 hypothetical protein [Saccharomonospora amisosensis]